MTHSVPHSVLKAYGLNPERCSCQPLGDGHIHRTLLTDTDGQTPVPLVFQEINTHVFPDPDLLMQNMERVTTHLAGKWETRLNRPSNGHLRLVKTLDNTSYTGDTASGFWRATWFLQGRLNFHRAPNRYVALEGGLAIGRFMHLLSDLPNDTIGEVIPRFHDLPWRLQQFDRALENAPAGRKQEADTHVRMVNDWRSTMIIPWELAREGIFRERLVHNDTKFNNLLFTSQMQDAILIDLDTVMPGYAFYDYGDALRTCVALAPEDEPDLDRVGVDRDLYAAFTDGYMEATGDELSAEERKHLGKAPAAFAFLMGLRFLTDYLQGDTYFATRHERHNLQRAAAQLRLMEKFHALEQEVQLW